LGVRVWGLGERGDRVMGDMARGDKARGDKARGELRIVDI